MDLTGRDRIELSHRTWEQGARAAAAAGRSDCVRWRMSSQGLPQSVASTMRDANRAIAQAPVRCERPRHSPCNTHRLPATAIRQGVPDWSEKKAIQQYREPAGGWGALRATGKALTEQGIPISGSATLLRMNQPEDFDCPGCAWPDPKHTSSFEFCENGAKAVAWEATSKRCPPEFFAARRYPNSTTGTTLIWRYRGV
jgi:hypothetical protein